MPLYLVRHAPVTLKGTCYGQIDVPTALTPQDALMSVRHSLHSLPNLTTVWSSPLARCLELAQMYSDRVHSEPRLMEAHFGLWVGLTWDEIHERYPLEMAQWGDNWLETPPPGGESARMVQARFDSFVTSLAPGCHLAFSHAGIIRAARVSLNGRSWPQAMAEPVEYLGVERFHLPSDTGEFSE